MMTRAVTIGVIAALAACTGASQETRGEGQGVVSARLLRIDPVDPSPTETRADFVLRLNNETVNPVTVNLASLEVYFTDDLDAAPTEPDEEEAAGEGGESDRQDQGGEGDGAEAEDEDDGSGGDTAEVEVFEGQAKAGVVVAAGMHLDLSVPVNLKYPDTAAQYLAFCRLGIAHLALEGKLETSVGTFTIKDNGEIPTPTLPEASAEEVQIASANDGETGEFSLVLKVFNPNVFSYKIRDWSYKLYVGDKMMREATVGLSERIQGNTAIQYDIMVPLTDQSWGSDVRKLLKQPEIPYRVEGTLRFRNISLPTQITGKVTFSR